MADIVAGQEGLAPSEIPSDQARIATDLYNFSLWVFDALDLTWEKVSMLHVTLERKQV